MTARAITIATSKGVGADAEVRDHQGTTNFGTSTELATRILDNAFAGETADGSDRFSAMYLKFDLTGVTASPFGTSLRLTFRNTNLTTSRLQDATPGGSLSFRTGLAYYALDRDDPGNNWSETTITYNNAPGMGTNPVQPLLSYAGGDLNNGTKDLDFRDPDAGGALRPPLIPLGVQLFPLPTPASRLAVGSEMLFSSNALNTFVQQALTAGKTTVTFVVCIAHDGKVPVNDWKNFNYLFNPKEQTTLVADTGYDPDGSGPLPSGNGPNSSASNATDANGFSPFSPQLILQVPEPTSLGLLGLALASLAAVRRR